MLREATCPGDMSVSVVDVMNRPDPAITSPDFSRPGDLAVIAEDVGKQGGRSAVTRIGATSARCSRWTPWRPSRSSLRPWSRAARHTTQRLRSMDHLLAAVADDSEPLRSPGRCVAHDVSTGVGRLEWDRVGPLGQVFRRCAVS
jgi:hypothetical protein